LWLNFDVAVYTALVSATDCDILLLPLPARVRHVKNGHTWLHTFAYTIIYSSAANNIQSNFISQRLINQSIIILVNKCKSIAVTVRQYGEILRAGK